MSLLGVALPGAGAGAAVSAQDPKVRLWAAACTSCHGTHGQSIAPVPTLAGRSKSDLLMLLMAFKQGRSKDSTIMHQFAVGYTDAQLERIAEFFSRQPR
jgi:cytochrome c553